MRVAGRRRPGEKTQRRRKQRQGEKEDAEEWTTLGDWSSGA